MYHSLNMITIQKAKSISSRFGFKFTVECVRMFQAIVFYPTSARKSSNRKKKKASCFWDEKYNSGGITL